jgi:hypothetical protein
MTFLAFFWAPQTWHAFFLRMCPCCPLSMTALASFFLFPMFILTLPNKLDIPFPGLHDTSHTLTVQNSAEHLEHALVFSFQLCHQSVAHDRQLVSFCWKNSEMNVEVSGNTLWDWAGWRKNRKAQRQGYSVASVETRGAADLSEQRQWESQSENLG